LSKSKELDDARKLYKENDKKARQSIFRYNHEGIAKHGVAWVHLGYHARLRWYMQMLADGAKIPEAVQQWAKDRGIDS
jgi:hypothetical protein